MSPRPAGTTPRRSGTSSRTSTSPPSDSAARTPATGEHIDENDLYPDVRPALATLQQKGLWVGLAGNQTAKAGSLLRKLDLPVDAIATSAEWGVAKPDPAFFRHVIELAGVAPNELLYVGDHCDNDVVAGHAAGLWTALIRRGPWGLCGRTPRRFWRTPTGSSTP
ncbi:HAD family hydrolase [Amycolatopsis balhimycina]|uniref:HAD family hydrolase n=1 Tax=Amycolatopsis balhimycina TaxID=208443 RepID=UPI0028985DA6|nr:HAD family hydrolase [Amycolatopsis balhimycina]